MPVVWLTAKQVTQAKCSVGELSEPVQEQRPRPELRYRPESAHTDRSLTYELAVWADDEIGAHGMQEPSARAVVRRCHCAQVATDPAVVPYGVKLNPVRLAAWPDDMNPLRFTD
jgi:hypothetical protein